MKITIIGAGIIGVTSAYFLAKDGHEVEVIERAHGPALETSFANAGMLTPSMADPWNAPGILGTLFSSLISGHSAFVMRPQALPSMMVWGLRFLNNSRRKLYYRNLHRSADLACYSMQVLCQLKADLDLKFDHIRTGSLKIFRDEKSLQKSAELSDELYDHDMSYEIVRGDALLSIDPSLCQSANKLCGGLYFPDDEAGNAYHFTCAMEKAALAAGVKFRYGISVEQMVKKNGRIDSILTDAGAFSSDLYILCAGSFSWPLAKTAGLNIPVRPAKGYSLSIPMKGWNDGPRMSINDDGFHAAITPLGETLRVAGTAEFAGHDITLRRDRLDGLYDLVGEIYPEFSKTIDPAQVTEWAGLRPLSLDGSPYIGKTAIENLCLNTGHGPLGWTMASGSAKLLADIISGSQPTLDPASYHLARA